MALQVWMPLIRNLCNLGLETCSISCKRPSFNSSGKIGSGKFVGSEVTITSSKLANSRIWSIAFWGHINSSSLTTDWTSIVILNDGGSGLRIQTCVPSDDWRKSWSYSVNNNTTYNIITTNLGSLPSSLYSEIYDNWIHFCLTCDGTTVSRYINGVLTGTTTCSDSGAIDGNIKLCNNNIIYKNDFRAYDHCLSLKEVKDISKGLSLHYLLNDAYVEDSEINSTTRVYDCSGYGNHGTIVGTLYESSDSARYSYSTEFNSSSYIYINDLNLYLPNFTISYWLKRPSSSLSKMFFGSGVGDWNWYHYGDNSFKFNLGEFYYLHNAGDSSSLADTWVHYCFIWNGSTLYVYRNGISEGVSSFSGTPYLLNISIGKGTSSNYWGEGQMSDFRIYATALSADDVKELYNTVAIIDNSNNLLTYSFLEETSELGITTDWTDINKIYMTGWGGTKSFDPTNGLILSSLNGWEAFVFTISEFNNQEVYIDFDFRVANDAGWSNGVSIAMASAYDASTLYSMGYYNNSIANLEKTSTWKHYHYKTTALTYFEFFLKGIDNLNLTCTINVKNLTIRKASSYYPKINNNGIINSLIFKEGAGEVMFSVDTINSNNLIET